VSEKSEKVHHTQIRLSEETYAQFKDYAESRNISQQLAGIEAIEYWIEIQRTIGSVVQQHEDPEKHAKTIKEAFQEALKRYVTKRRMSRFDDDALFSDLLGMTIGDSDLSRTHGRHSPTE